MHLQQPLESPPPCNLGRPHGRVSRRTGKVSVWVLVLVAVFAVCIAAAVVDWGGGTGPDQVVAIDDKGKKGKKSKARKRKNKRNSRKNKVAKAARAKVDVSGAMSASKQAVSEALAPDASLVPSASDTDVLLVIVCTLRLDRLQPYGYERASSPFLDQLASAGVLFEKSFTQAPWTRPSVGTILTGRYARALKLDSPLPRGEYGLVLDPSHTTLAEAFSAADYTTLGVVANPNAKAQFGMAQGFDHYVEPEKTYKEGTVLPSGDEKIDELLELVGKVPEGKRFFAQLLLTGTHEPRKPHNAFVSLFQKQKSSGYSMKQIRYDASVRTVDQQLAHLVTALRAERPNLLVAVVNDHGEGLNQPFHHGRGHGNYLYQSAIGNPQIWFHPGLPDPGRRIGGLMMNIDVHPTMLDLLGLASSSVVDGKSQRAAIMGETDRGAHDLAFSETMFRKSWKTTVIDGTLQLIRDHHAQEVGEDGVQETLYALTDRDGVVDLSESMPEDHARLSQALTQWEAQMNELDATSPDAVTIELDGQMRAQLEAMGYLE